MNSFSQSQKKIEVLEKVHTFQSQNIDYSLQSHACWVMSFGIYTSFNIHTKLLRLTNNVNKHTIMARVQQKLSKITAEYTFFDDSRTLELISSWARRKKSPQPYDQLAALSQNWIIEIQKHQWAK